MTAANRRFRSHTWLILAGGLVLSVNACEQPTTVRSLFCGTSQLQPRLDAREFLCRFSGGPTTKPDGSPGERLRAAPGLFPGRRFTSEERRAARQTIGVELRRLGLEPREHRYVRFHGKPGVNLYAELKASRPTESWVIVSAHYDTVSISPGADDNGSGVTAVLMVADILTRLSARPTNVMFVFFDQEEVGLIGSQAFVQRLKKMGRKPLMVHNLDMVGWDQDNDGVVELGRPDSRTAWRYYQAANRLRCWQSRQPDAPLVGINRTNMGRSDHVSFLRQGWPALMVSEEFVGQDDSPYYHQPRDTCDRIDYRYLKTVAWLVAIVVAR